MLTVLILKNMNKTGSDLSVQHCRRFPRRKTGEPFACLCLLAAEKKATGASFFMHMNKMPAISDFLSDFRCGSDKLTDTQVILSTSAEKGGLSGISQVPDNPPFSATALCQDKETFRTVQWPVGN